MPTIGPTYRHPGSPCTTCTRMLDSSNQVAGEEGPSAGDISLCTYCGAVNIFDESLIRRAPTPEEEREIVADPQVQAAREAIARSLGRWPGREAMSRALNAEGN